MKLSNICCVSTLMGDRLSITLCSGSMHEPCVGLKYFRLRPACLRLINLVQFMYILVHGCSTLFYNLVHGCKTLYMAVQLCTQFYNIVHACTTFYKVVQDCTTLYTVL